MVFFFFFLLTCNIHLEHKKLHSLLLWHCSDLPFVRVSICSALLCKSTVYIQVFLCM